MRVAYDVRPSRPNTELPPDGYGWQSEQRSPLSPRLHSARAAVRAAASFLPAIDETLQVASAPEQPAQPTRLDSPSPGPEGESTFQARLADVVAGNALGTLTVPEFAPRPNQKGKYDQLVGPEGEIRWGLARAVGHAALNETRRIAHEERCLTEVDNLLRHRLPDGTYPEDVLAALHTNNKTRVIEPAMPFAVSTTFQECIEGDFYWKRQSGLQVAASGYRYHDHEEALQRNDVEVAEAIFVDECLPAGKTSVLFSPRMSYIDAAREVAEHEHLAEDDSIRVQWVAHNLDGSIRGKYVQSILIRSDLRKAWVDMLADPNNIFGKSISVENPDSALSLMKSFTETQIDSSKLPEGVVTLLEATIPYISDAKQRKEVLAMLPEYRNNQQRMQQVAEDIASRWDVFDRELADSLATGQATPAITRFISNIGRQWNDDDFKLFARHQITPGNFTMSRELAVRLEQAQESILCAQAAIMVRNKRVLDQLDPHTARQIADNVERLNNLIRAGASWQQLVELERHTTFTTASQNIETGGGCPGNINGKFRTDISSEGSGSEAANESGSDREISKKKKMNCPFCKAKVYDDPCAKVLECRDCKAKVVNGKLVNPGNGGSKARAAKMGVNGIGFWIRGGGKPKAVKPPEEQSKTAAKNDYALAA